MTAYILKSSLSLILLFVLYWFLLRKEKLFRFNRYFLIFSVIFSLVIPVISIPVYLTEESQGSGLLTAVGSFTESFETDQVQPVIQEESFPLAIPEYQQQGFHSDNSSTALVLLAIYLSGVLVFSLRFIRNILFIKRQVARSAKSVSAGYTLALTDEQVNPYSFFRTIVVNKDDYRNNKISSRLIDHELEHVMQSHSIDIVSMELIRIFYWFNPLLLLYSSAIRINHEYLADSGVIRESADIRGYAENLIGYICRQKNVKLASGFNPSATRKRLLMLISPEQGKASGITRIFLSFIAAITVFMLLSCVTSVRYKSGTVKDIDGNVYKTVTIGKQVWMSENLKTTRYNDGGEISLITDSLEWQKYDPAYCWYKNDEAVYKDKFGALYNWYAVSTNKLCPAGWHLPDMIEFWSTLPDYLEHNGYGLGASGKEIAKSLASTTGWRPDTLEYNIGNDPASNNKTGFSAVPTGFRSQTGTFGEEGEYASWWSSDDYNQYIGKGYSLVNYYSRLQPLWVSKRTGYSVRCVKDLTDSHEFADFSGTWELNMQKSKGLSDAVGRTLRISHVGDKITMQESYALTTSGIDKDSFSYILDGKELNERIIDSTIVQSSAKWSAGKQSFTITDIWIQTVRGKRFVNTYKRTYFMTDDEKTLVIYTIFSFPAGSYVPPEERESVTYYDRR